MSVVCYLAPSLCVVPLWCCVISGCIRNSNIARCVCFPTVQDRTNVNYWACMFFFCFSRTLAGSTIMLLTLPWLGSLILGRVDRVNGVGQDLQCSRFTPKSFYKQVQNVHVTTCKLAFACSFLPKAERLIEGRGNNMSRSKGGGGTLVPSFVGNTVCVGLAVSPTPRLTPSVSQLAKCHICVHDISIN